MYQVEFIEFLVGFSSSSYWKLKIFNFKTQLEAQNSQLETQKFQFKIYMSFKLKIRSFKII